MPVPGFIFLLGMISGLEWGGEARIEAGKGGGEDSKPALGFMQPTRTLLIRHITHVSLPMA